MGKDKIAGIPFVLIAHALIFTLLVALVMTVLLQWFVTTPLSLLNSRISNLEGTTMQVAPTREEILEASPSATPTPTGKVLKPKDILTVTPTLRPTK